MSAAHHVESIIIGAGVVGLSCARALARKGKEVLVFERESVIGSGTSSRNSEVIHAGLYYPPNSLKAELCVRGRKLLYEFCQERNVEYSKIGKLIVANSVEQYESNLMEIKARGEANGVENLRLLSRQDVHRFEPEVECYGALYSPETGVLDSHGFMLSLLADAENHGTTLALNTQVDNVYNHHTDGTFIVQSEDMDLSCDILVNCAGLFAGHIAAPLFSTKSSTPNSPLSLYSSITSSGQTISTYTPTQQYYAKGNYFRLQNQKNPFHHLIYPIPEPGGLGVHATIDLGGYCRFGPDVEWISPDFQNPDTIPLQVDPRRADKFYNQIRQYWPNLKDGNLVPDYAGLRPKVDHPFLTQNMNEQENRHNVVGNKDFVVQGVKEHGIEGYIHFMGIESPGLTSSLALAERMLLLLSLNKK